MKKEVVNVRSQEEWDYVTEKSGIKWSNGACWQHIGEECCINIYDKKYWSIDVYQNENFSILSFEEFKTRYEPSEEVVNSIKDFSDNLNKMIEYTLDYGIDNIFKDLKELNINKIQPIEELVEEENQILKKQKERNDNLVGKVFQDNLNKINEYLGEFIGRYTDRIIKQNHELVEKVVNEKFKKQMQEVNLTIEQAKEFIPKDKWKEFGIEEEIVLREWEEL